MSIRYSSQDEDCERCGDGYLPLTSRVKTCSVVSSVYRRVAAGDGEELQPLAAGTRKGAPRSLKTGFLWSILFPRSIDRGLIEATPDG